MVRLSASTCVEPLPGPAVLFFASLLAVDSRRPYVYPRRKPAQDEKKRGSGTRGTGGWFPFRIIIWYIQEPDTPRDEMEVFCQKRPALFPALLHQHSLLPTHTHTHTHWSPPFLGPPSINNTSTHPSLELQLFEGWIFRKAIIIIYKGRALGAGARRGATPSHDSTAGGRR